MRNIIDNISVVLFYALFIYAEGWGLYHSFDKHSGVAAFLIPPVAWYHSAEYWWHSNEEEVNADIKNCVYFIHNYTTDSEPSFNKDLIEFHNRLANYNESEVDKLKEFSKLIILWRESQFVDMLSAIENYNYQELFKDWKSPNTRSLEDKIILFKAGEVLINFEAESLDSLENIFGDNLSLLDSYELEDIKIKANLEFDTNIRLYKAAYQEMFNEGFVE